MELWLSTKTLSFLRQTSDRTDVLTVCENPTAGAPRAGEPTYCPHLRPSTVFNGDENSVKDRSVSLSPHEIICVICNNQKQRRIELAGHIKCPFLKIFFQTDSKSVTKKEIGRIRKKMQCYRITPIMADQM